MCFRPFFFRLSRGDNTRSGANERRFFYAFSAEIADADVDAQTLVFRFFCLEDISTTITSQSDDAHYRSWKNAGKFVLQTMF